MHICTYAYNMYIDVHVYMYMWLCIYLCERMYTVSECLSKWFPKYVCPSHVQLLLDWTGRVVFGRLEGSMWCTQMESMSAVERSTPADFSTRKLGNSKARRSSSGPAWVPSFPAVGQLWQNHGVDESKIQLYGPQDNTTTTATNTVMRRPRTTITMMMIKLTTILIVIINGDTHHNHHHHHHDRLLLLASCPKGGLGDRRPCLHEAQ